METAILARHGESELSIGGVLNGDPRVRCALTERGEEQARALGRALAQTPLGLCVTSEFERARQTAELALAGRDVPRLVLAELNDVRYGSYEGGAFDDYLRWAASADPEAEAPGRGESRAAIANRYTRAYRTILERPESTILVVAHGLAVRYVLDALAGRDPVPVVDQVPYARPYAVKRAELEQAVQRLERWAAAPAWA